MNLSNFYIILLIAFLFSETAGAQNPTVGLMLNDEDAYNGYVLFAPNGSSKAFLIDNCGYVINEWNFSPGSLLGTYLLEDGSIMRTSWSKLEHRSWEDELIWLYEVEDGISHHDCAVLPNGNVIIIFREQLSLTEVIEAGRNPLNASAAEVDMFMEIEASGVDQGEIIWEWKSSDHLIQEFDNSKSNYGVIADHPGRLNINFDNEPSMLDWLHMNGVQYNDSLDQILFSSRNTNEIYIIDHSTTTAEAASEYGGNSGKGGAFLWRWGNPQIYEQGTAADQKLFGQHAPEWIPSDYINGNKITVFNNSFQFGQSAVHILDVSPTADGFYPMSNSRFLPEDYEFTWAGQINGENFFSFIQSSANAMPNGNIFIAGHQGRFIEVDPSGEIIWMYFNPQHLYVTTQYEYFIESDVFKPIKYPDHYPAFSDKSIEQLYLIESVNSISDSCVLFDNIFPSDTSILDTTIIDTTVIDTTIIDTTIIDTTIIDTTIIDTTVIDTTVIDTTAIDTTMIDTILHVHLETSFINVYPNPADEILFIEAFHHNLAFQLFSINGLLVTEGKTNFIDTKELREGMYILHVRQGEHLLRKKIMIQH